LLDVFDLASAFEEYLNESELLARQSSESAPVEVAFHRSVTSVAFESRDAKGRRADGTIGRSEASHAQKVDHSSFLSSYNFIFSIPVFTFMINASTFIVIGPSLRVCPMGPRPSSEGNSDRCNDALLALPDADA
jgi:hypothetical protein